MFVTSGQSCRGDDSRSQRNSNWSILAGIAVGQHGMNRQVGGFPEPKGLEIAQHRRRVGESVVRALGQGPLDGPRHAFADAGIKQRKDGGGSLQCCSQSGRAFRP